MLCAGGYKIDAGCLNGAVAQHVGQTHNILAGFVENGSEQMPQIVGKHFGRLHPGVFAQVFHAAFLAPLMVTSPTNGLPPFIIYCSITHLCCLQSF